MEIVVFFNHQIVYSQSQLNVLNELDEMGLISKDVDIHWQEVNRDSYGRIFVRPTSVTIHYNPIPQKPE